MIVEIKAFVRPSQIDPIVHALESIGVTGMTITAVDALGKLADQHQSHLSPEYVKTYCKVYKLELVCRRSEAQAVVQRIQRLGCTGEPGDGIVYVMPVEDLVKIRTGEEGESCLDPINAPT